MGRQNLAACCDELGIDLADAEGGFHTVTRTAVKQRVPSPPAFLQRIASKGAYDTEASSPAVLTYLTLLDRVLEDRVIDTNEQETLVSTIEQLGFSRGQVVAAHTTYLQHLTAQALADGVVTDTEQADLESVADLLGTEKAGLVIANNVTKKLDVLVVADPNTQSGKAKKARSYGTRIVAERVFWQMIGVATD
jgi:DNA polymerase-3 subunit epsilon